MSRQSFEVQDVKLGQEAYAAVLALWRRESGSLGFLPEGGFEDAAHARSLLAATTASGEVAGYVLFRRAAAGVVVIVHLCVAPHHRGSGLARLLLDSLRSRCAASREFRLRCRRDFAANALWPRLGFVAVGEVPGRGRDRAPLTVWRLETSPLPLLHRLSDGVSTRALAVVIDANVFFDLDEPARESNALLADWLGEFVDLQVTAEIYNEIDRNDDASHRAHQRARVSDFAMAPRDADKELELVEQLEVLFGDQQRTSTRSDCRQLAMTAAAGLAVFVTRDRAIRDLADQLYDLLGVRVVTPVELIRTADELRREQLYRPQRIAGPSLTSRAARSGDLDAVEAMHHAGQTGPEPRLATRARLRAALSDPQRFEAVCVETRGDLLAAYVLERPRPEILAVPFFAVASSPLGRTAARQLAEWIISVAAEECRVALHVAEPADRVAEALEELGFSREPQGWTRLSIGGIGAASTLADNLEARARDVESAAALAARFALELRRGDFDADSSATAARASTLERTLWPTKLTGAGILNFIIAIEPHWAHELFDRGLASETLFGADPSLILKHENVYYRSPKPGVLRPSSRLLWYVKKSSGYPGARAVRACSRIDDVEVGAPKDLYSRYKRLGVYSWQHVKAASRGDLVMAVRFAQTELFRRAIPFDELQEILRRHTGKGNQIQGPVAVSEALFSEIYRRGMLLDG